MPNDIFPRRTGSFIRVLLRDVLLYLFILAIPILAIWKLVEFIF